MTACDIHPEQDRPCHIRGVARVRAALSEPDATSSGPKYATDHGFTPHTGPFGRPGEPERCRVMLARYACPYSREEHDPTLPPVDLDVFGYRRPTETGDDRG